MAIQMLNKRILPVIKLSPKDILLGSIINTSKTPEEEAMRQLTEEDLNKQLAYMAQQRFNGYTEAVEHTVQRKTVFDRRVKRSGGGVAEWKEGDLVQVFRSERAKAVGTERKLTPMWRNKYRTHTN